MKIIITGSLGHIGRPLTQELVQKGHEVTVISTKPEKQKEIEALGAAAATGSLEDGDFLSETFKGADAVFAMVPPNFAEANQIAYYKRLAHNYAGAVKQAGVRHIVHLSSYGADLSSGTGFILGAHHAEKILDALAGVAVTHLRPGYFYYNLYNFTDMVKQAGFIGSNYGDDDKMILVSPADIVAAAAEELQADVTGNKVRYIASDDYRANEIAGILGEAIGQPGLKWVTFTNEQTQKAMQEKGAPEHIAANFTELGAAIHNGKLREDYDRSNTGVTGKVKLKDFAKEFAEVFKKV